MKEKQVSSLSGLMMLPVLLIWLVFCAIQFVGSIAENSTGFAILAAIAAVSGLICLGGFFTVQPNQGCVLQLFGKYKGTVRSAGLFWTNPFYTKNKVSLRVRNFETNHLKVNDQDGNPIEIAAVVVWNVIDTAEAVFRVDNYENYVHVQSEAALRNLATAYPYDAHSDHQVSLRGHTATIAGELKREVQERLSVAGVEVIEARISHLAYAPEIAASMLQRQQASAIIGARQKIVEGAVGMVEMALKMLSDNKIVELDDERKAAMVSNLLVVLCSERSTQPIVNTGTIYH